MCNEGCEHCIYIGEGDYYCDLYKMLVGENFSIEAVCPKEQEHDV